MSSDEPYPHNGDVWWADPAFNCPDCLRSTAVGCGCERGGELEATKRITSWEKMEDRHAEQDIIDRARDRADRAAGHAASMARAEASARAKAAKLVDVGDPEPEGDGSYSISEAKAGKVLRQLRDDQAEARRVHGPGGDVDAD